MNDIFHTKEMKPPLLTCLTLSQHIQKSVTLALRKQGAVLVLNQVADSGGDIAYRPLTE